MNDKYNLAGNHALITGAARVHSLQATWQDSHLVPGLWAVQHRTVGASVHPSGQTTDHQASGL